MSAFVQEACSCLVKVMLLEVTCSDSKQGTMKWELTGPSASAVVDYIVEKEQNGSILASNLTIHPCQSTCNAITQPQQEEQVSEAVRPAIAVASIAAVVTIAVAILLLIVVVGCVCHKKRQKRKFAPPNETPRRPVPNPLYSNIAIGDEEGHQAGQQDLAAPPDVAIGDEEGTQAEPQDLAACPHPANLPAEQSMPVAIVDTIGYSKLQHFTGNWNPSGTVRVLFNEDALEHEVRTVERSYCNTQILNPQQRPLDAAHGTNVAPVASSNQSGTAAGSAEEDPRCVNGSEQLVGGASLDEGTTTYTVNCRPPYLPTRAQSSDSDFSSMSNSPSTELHLTVPSRVRRSNVFDDDQDEVFGSSEVSRREPKRHEKPPIPLPRRRRCSNEDVLENEGACSEAPFVYEDVVLAKS